MLPVACLQVKELFEKHDEDDSGILDKDEFRKMVQKAEKYMKLPFNMDENWAELKKVPFNDGADEGVVSHYHQSISPHRSRPTTCGGKHLASAERPCISSTDLLLT